MILMPAQQISAINPQEVALTILLTVMMTSNVPKTLAVAEFASIMPITLSVMTVFLAHLTYVTKHWDVAPTLQKIPFAMTVILAQLMNAGFLKRNVLTFQWIVEMIWIAQMTIALLECVPTQLTTLTVTMVSIAPWIPAVSP
jgi:hypothetical protein